MLQDIITKGSTDRSVTMRIIDSTDGTPETAVAYNTSGIDLWYRREGGAKVSLTEASLSALTDAHTDGGVLHVGDGVYRVDLPDAAFATGANYVDFGGTVTGMVVVGGRVKLVSFNFEDAVRGGLTALPNANAGASGGLPTADSGNDVGVQTIFKKNQGINNFTFLMVDATTEIAATGLTVTAQRSIDGGALGSGTLGAVSEIGSGLYKLDIPQADLNGDTVTLVFTATGAKTRMLTLFLEP
jgi:hypothetical protein